MLEDVNEVLPSKTGQYVVWNSTHARQGWWVAYYVSPADEPIVEYSRWSIEIDGHSYDLDGVTHWSDLPASKEKLPTQEPSYYQLIRKEQGL